MPPVVFVHKQFLVCMLLTGVFRCLICNNIIHVYCVHNTNAETLS